MEDDQNKRRTIVQLFAETDGAMGPECRPMECRAPKRSRVDDGQQFAETDSAMPWMSWGLQYRPMEDRCRAPKRLKPDQMWLWSELEHSVLPPAYPTPGRISPSAWPPAKPPVYSVISELHGPRIQTESIRPWTPWTGSVQTDVRCPPISRTPVRVQMEDTGPHVTRGLPGTHSELSKILPSLVNGRMPYFHRPSARKPILNSKQPMRPLCWTSFRLITPVTETKKEECLWYNLEEITPENWEEFEELFSKQAVLKKKSPEGKEKKKQNRGKEVAKLLDQERSQNVGILIWSLHLDIAEIQHALYSFDTSTVNTDTIQSIYDIRPTPDELQTISSHRTARPGVPLDKPEQFLLDLSLISEYAIRMECVMFHTSFAKNIAQVKRKLDNLQLTCEFLAGKTVLNVISIILSLGNYMNGGNRGRGQADGFGLEILPKLCDVISKDDFLTLLHYIVKMYNRTFEKDTPAKEWHLPLPEPSAVERAGSVHFDDFQKELDRLYVQTLAYEKKVHKILDSSTEEQQKHLKEVVQPFLRKAFIGTRLQAKNLESCKTRFKYTLKFYRFQTKSNNESEWPKEFFSQWTSFCQDFKDIWKEEQQRRIHERIDQMEKRVNEINNTPKVVVIKTRANGLKARLLKLARRKQQSRLAKVVTT